MRLPLLRRSRPAGEPGVSGTVRLDSRTKTLTKRLKPGDVAVIDHEDLDRVSAEALVSRQVGAVVNAAQSTSGRYPNLGPEILLAAGIPLVDGVGAEVFDAIDEGEEVRVHGNELLQGDRVVASGLEQTAETVTVAMASARENLNDQLEAFADNTMEYLKRERDLLLDGVGVPEITTELEGKQVLIVVRGYHYKEDIATLRPYIREYSPVLIGVDGGADALIEAGYKPAIIVGDMDSVSDKALSCGAELIVHAYRDGRAPGLQRLEELGVPAVVFPATGTSEDVAMLLADDKGAVLIVAVGTHATLVEFLDKGRSGMASTFLTRLRVGSKLVDAKGVSMLYRQRISGWWVVLLLLAGLIALGVSLGATPLGRSLYDIGGSRWDDFTFWLRGIF
jgi:uncharacterized membrane-anchored protein